MRRHVSEFRRKIEKPGPLMLDATAEDPTTDRHGILRPIPSDTSCPEVRIRCGCRSESDLAYHGGTARGRHITDSRSLHLQPREQTGKLLPLHRCDQLTISHRTSLVTLFKSPRRCQRLAGQTQSKGQDCESPLSMTTVSIRLRHRSNHTTSPHPWAGEEMTMRLLERQPQILPQESRSADHNRRRPTECNDDGAGRSLLRTLLHPGRCLTLNALKCLTSVNVR
jgi:hypothetical protein